MLEKRFFGYFSRSTHLQNARAMKIIEQQNMFLPEQVVPFPVYPVLQTHENEPSIFVQVAFA